MSQCMACVHLYAFIFNRGFFYGAPTPVAPVVPTPLNDAYLHHDTVSIMMPLPSLSLGNRFCMSRKCGTVCGGWHHSGGGNSTAVSVLVCDRSPWSEPGGLFRGPSLSLVGPLVSIDSPRPSKPPVLIACSCRGGCRICEREGGTINYMLPKAVDRGFFTFIFQLLGWTLLAPSCFALQVSDVRGFQVPGPACASF